MAATGAPAVSLPLGLSLKDARQRMLVATFEHLGQRDRAAAMLGISDRSLHQALKDHAALRTAAAG